jgi:hypothetical protein
MFTRRTPKLILPVTVVNAVAIIEKDKTDKTAGAVM